MGDDSEQVLEYLFYHFDTSGDGVLNIFELRLTLRQYGLYFSLHQTEELFRNVGVPPGQKMDLEQFKRMIVEFKKYMPTKDLFVHFCDKPPSLMLDIAMRWAFICAYVICRALHCRGLCLIKPRALLSGRGDPGTYWCNHSHPAWPQAIPRVGCR